MASVLLPLSCANKFHCPLSCTGRTSLSFQADSHIACRSPAMPCRLGFRMCLSHLIYTVRPCLIHTCHAMLRPCPSSQGHSTARTSLDGRAVALRRTSWSKHGMASVNQTRPHCVNQMEMTHSKPLAARHSRGTAWARHAMCV